MTTATTQTTGSFEELDYRDGDGIEVSLLWSRTTNELSVLVVDTNTDEQLELCVEPDEALEVFHHPFAYADTHAVDSSPSAAGHIA